MVVFEKTLGLELDGIEFDPKGTGGAYRSLGWASRNTSKPGRDRDDGRECWVLQSYPDAVREVLKGMKNVRQVRERVWEFLVWD